jgi:hypothetical protein
VAIPGLEGSHFAVTDVAQAIQLSLGPVFLLSGIGVLLNVQTTRLARIVDRARVLEERLAVAGADDAHSINGILATTSRRARLTNRAITFSTVAALLVALMVAVLFATAFVRVPLGAPIALLFIAAMLTLVGSLWCFLIEVRVSTEHLRFGAARFKENSN